MEQKTHSNDKINPMAAAIKEETSTNREEQKNLDNPFSPYDRFRSLMNTSLYAAMCVHTLFIVLFFFRDVYILSLVNVGSVLIYVYAIYLVKQGKDGQAIFLAWLEILGHAAICTVVIGFETGFHYYILVLLPFVFLNVSRSMISKVSVTVFLCMVYVGLVYISDHMAVANVLNQHSVVLMKYVNIIMCLGLIAGQSHIYSQSVIDGENELKQINKNLQNALSEVKTLRGIVPICSFCKKVRDDQGYWERVDVYIGQHSYADISHSICPDCLEKHYPEYSENVADVENN